jgi:hypothetical protein
MPSRSPGRVRPSAHQCPHGHARVKCRPALQRIWNTADCRVDRSVVHRALTRLNPVQPRKCAGKDPGAVHVSASAMRSPSGWQRIRRSWQRRAQCPKIGRAVTLRARLQPRLRVQHHNIRGSECRDIANRQYDATHAHIKRAKRRQVGSIPIARPVQPLLAVMLADEC